MSAGGEPRDGPAESAFTKDTSILGGVIESCPQAMVAFDSNARVVIWNKSAEHLFGYPSRDVLGHSFPGGNEPLFQDLIREVYQDGASRQVESTCLRHDGTSFHVRLTGVPLRDPQGAVCGVITTAEQAPLKHEDSTPLREQEARLRAILETVPDAIIVIDDRAMIQSFSSAAERQFGYRADEVIGRNVSILMPTPYREEHDGYVDRYQRTHERRIIGIGREVYGQRKNGSIFPMYLSVGEGKLEGVSLYVGIIHDITEQQATERKLRELQDELLQVSRMSGMGQMASSLAHELNQPLTAVSSLMQAARRMLEVGDPAAVARARDAVDRAGQQVLRAGEIIRRLREFAARGDTEKVVVPVDTMINEAMALARISNKFGTTKVQVRLVEAAMVVVDKVQIQQVILNLVRNSLEAMEAVPAPALTVSARVDEDMVGVEIADVGPGIAPEVRERLFEPFVTTKHHGMGVGLAICRTIIEAHGGKLHADDNPGGGTVFRFTLSRAIEEADDDSN